MKGDKTTQTQSQNYSGTTSYGWQTPPETSDVSALRNFKFNRDPGVGAAYGQAKNELANTFASPLRGNYTPQMRDAMLRSSYAKLGQQQAQSESEEGQRLQGAQFGQQATVAGMTQPRLTTTGSSGSGNAQSTTVQQQDVFGQILGGGMMAASM